MICNCKTSKSWKKLF